MENPVGRLDLLLLGIIERAASSDPLARAAFRAFEPEIRRFLKPLDFAPLRKAIREAAANPEPPARKRRIPQPNVRRVKRIPARDPQPVPVLEAEWVS